MNKFTESVADVMRYIVNAEMGGQADPKHHLYPTYLDLRDMFGKVKSHNETLDLESHCILRNDYSFEEKPKHYYHPEEVANRKWVANACDYDTEIEGVMYD